MLLFEAIAAKGFADDAIMRSVFDETETIVKLSPANQVDWAEGYARSHGIRTSAKEIQEAVNKAFPNDPPGMKAQINLITLLIMMGDVVGALRSYAVLNEGSTSEYTRLIVKKLDKVREARSTVIRNFARTKPPRAYAGSNPQTAARSQDRASKYTQFVQMSTQLMNELQNSERELVDALQTMQRNLNAFWEAYASMRDEQFRTNDRVMKVR